jgi:hypothetical protein
MEDYFVTVEERVISRLFISAESREDAERIANRAMDYDPTPHRTKVLGRVFKVEEPLTEAALL